MEDRFFLTIDTSLKGLSLRLVMEGADSHSVLASQYFFTNQIAAAKMPSILESLLSSHGVDGRSLKRIGVSIGPGSFTGIKVGLSFVTAYAAGTPGLEAVGVSPMECLAFYHKGSAWFLPATKKQGYLSLWQDGAPKLFVVDIVNDCISLASEDGREPTPVDIIKDRNIELLLPWDMISSSLEELGLESTLHNVEFSSMLIQDAMVNALESRILLNSDLLPRYVRKSAPEELKERKG